VTSEHYWEVFKEDFLPLSKAWLFGLRKHLFSRMGLYCIQKMQFWMPLVSILVIMLSRIASLDVLAMDGLGHHVFLISAPVITFYVCIWKTTCTETTPSQLRNSKKKKISSVVIRITADILSWIVAIFHCQLQMVLDAGGAHIEHVLHWQIRTAVPPKFNVLSNTKVIPVH
jgi:hypothetical protein